MRESRFHVNPRTRLYGKGVWCEKSAEVRSVLAEATK
jgi:hypothetical protein